MGVSICSKSGDDSLMHQFHGRRTSAGISHIGFRIMYHHGIRFFDQVHFVLIDIDAVSQKCLRSQDIPVIETVHDAFVMLF